MNKRRATLYALLVLALAGTLALAVQDLPYLSGFLRLVLGAAVVLTVLWLLWRLYRAFLWKVGRRLALSYFLIGVLPIPMVALLLLVASYLLAGFFLGHLYRDALTSVDAGLEQTARDHLEPFARSGRPGPADDGEVAFAYYRGGRRIAGDERLPARWPAWLAAAGGAVPFLQAGESRITRGVALGDAERGVAALFVGDLERTLSRKSGVWVELLGSSTSLDFRVGGAELPIQMGPRERPAEAREFFAARGGSEALSDRPLLWWGELSAPVVDLADGRRLAESMAVSLNATPRAVYQRLFSTSAEVDAVAWGALFGLAFLLFDIYVVAVVMAVFLIFGISRAVNRMSAATAAVQSGDFSTRIPVRRRDQVGALQRSFNQMAANLEQLVATATQKELLEKELEIARDLQQSLVPHDLPAVGGLEFATLFEPSAAIGGDYFDLLRISERKLAVITADVSGHGLSTGLRMAMLKSALQILVEEAREPLEILGRLDAVVRSERESRVFVTATLAIVDFTTGHVELTNAGHPPTYRLRDGRVEEILLPGSPLGAIGRSFGRTELELLPGDVLVWLSDGLIEATDPDGDPFGYERVIQALAGAGTDAAQVRDRLLAAVAAYTRGEPAEDDRTLVVMRYQGSPLPNPSDA